MDHATYLKVLRVIRGSRTISHIIGAKNYLLLWKKTLKFPRDASIYARVYDEYSAARERVKKGLP